VSLWNNYSDVLERAFTSSLPHFHAIYAEYKATINIKNLCIDEGQIPRRAAQLVLDWAGLHQEDLIEDWELCQSKLQPNKIEPLR